MDDENLIRINKAYHELIVARTAIPDAMKVQLFQAQYGKPLPSTNEWRDFIRFEFYHHTPAELADMGYSLSTQDAQNLVDADCFIEEITSHTLRDYIGWGLLSEENIESISHTLNQKNSSGLLEIGCGSGYWSQVLKHRLSQDIQACEINIRQDTPKPSFFKALELNAVDAIDKFPDHDILLIWPDINTVANEVIEHISSGKLLVLATSIDVSANYTFYKSLDEWFDLSNMSDSISFSSGNQGLYFLTKRQTPKNDSDNTHYFANHYRKNRPEFKMSKKLV